MLYDFNKSLRAVKHSVKHKRLLLIIIISSNFVVSELRQIDLVQ